MIVPRRRRATSAACLLLGVALASAACSSDTGSAEIGPAELMARIQAGSAPPLLDVRTPQEFERGHVPGATNIPHDQLASRLSEIDVPPHQEIVVYCESGRRAAMASETLEAAGFTAIRHLTGDMSAWREAGRPSE